MAPEIGKLGVAWTAAKKAYKAKAKYKKPADYTLFWRKGTGIEAALKKVDATYGKAWTSQAAFNTYNTAQVALAAVAKTYKEKLDDIIEAAKKDQGIPSGVAKDVYSQAVSELNMALSDIGNVARKHAMQSMTALNMTKSLNATVARGLTHAANVKRTPTAAEFNTGIAKAARDITQQIGNIDTLKAQGMDTGYKGPKNLVTILAAWGDKNRKVSDSATQKQVLSENAAFEQAVLGVQKWLAAGGK